MVHGDDQGMKHYDGFVGLSRSLSLVCTIAVFFWVFFSPSPPTPPPPFPFRFVQLFQDSLLQHSEDFSNLCVQRAAFSCCVMMCCVVLRCDVLCCAVLSHVVMCCVVLGSTVIYICFLALRYVYWQNEFPPEGNVSFELWILRFPNQLWKHSEYDGVQHSTGRCVGHKCDDSEHQPFSLQGRPQIHPHLPHPGWNHCSGKTPPAVGVPWANEVRYLSAEKACKSVKSSFF